MTGDLTTYLRGPEPSTDGDYTGLQRRAMAEALRLSAATVKPLEAQIETDYQAARQKAQQQFAFDKNTIETDLRARSEAIRREHDAKLKTAQEQYEKELGEVKVDAQHRRNRINQKVTELEDAAKEKYRDQVMVTDFVADGASTKAEQGRAAAQSTVETGRRHLDALAAHAEELLQLYRQPVASPDTVADPESTTTYENPGQTYCEQQALAQERLETLSRLFTAQLFTGARPLLLAGGVLGATVVLLGILYLLNIPSLPSVLVTGPLALCGVAVLTGLGGRALWQQAKRQVQRQFAEFQDAMVAARAALEQQHRLTLQDTERQLRTSLEQKEAELRRAHENFESAKTAIAKQRFTSLREIDENLRDALDRLTRRRDEAVRDAERELQECQSALERRSREELERTQARYDSEIAIAEKEYGTSRRMLEDRWDKGLACIDAVLAGTTHLDPRVTSEWDHLLVDSWTPAKASPSAVRFGTFRLDLRAFADAVLARAESRLSSVEPAVLPALLELPNRCSMLLQSPREGRQAAIDTLRAVMMRLFTSFPPGRVRFTIVDPVGLGESFAGFMHAGDYQEALVGGRIWTDTNQIQQRLEDLTQHMENVIQKYLRNEFDTIEQYNEQAAELAEPYHFLVIADFPTNFNEEAARRLSSIIHSGPRCGVHTLIAYDTRHDLPASIDMKDVSANSIHLVYENGAYVWQDPVLRRFPLTLDRPPEEATLTRIMHVVGKACTEAARVEVPFETIAPKEQGCWSLDSREGLRVSLGRTGATRLQYLGLGWGVAQHMLIAGKTGSGKSTLFHVMVTNLALWYSPEEVEFYLIDFKQGVEFKTYVTHRLPHARAIAIESDREFGLSILQRLDAEMTYRGEMFRKAGVQDINAYRQSTGRKMPRTVLIVDEFQVFFSEDDRLGQDAAVLLEQLVRQGRAFGIHVVLGSQTLAGVSGLARSTIGQMAVRIALQCSEADSQLILDDENVAARFLSRPGEAIYNDVSGRVAGNSPFQVSWLPDSVRDSYLGRVTQLAHDKKIAPGSLVVFEGSVPADLAENRQLAECVEREGPPAEVSSPRIWLGAPVTMKEPTAVTLRRQSGANVLIVGQRADVAMNLVSAGILSLAAQLPRQSVQFAIFDGSPTDTPQAGVLKKITSALPHTCRLVPWRSVPEVLAELAGEVEQRTSLTSGGGMGFQPMNHRQDADATKVQGQDALATMHNAPTIVLVVYGLQRYRMLRRSEDAFGLSLDETAEARPDVLFSKLLKEGPAVGVHVLAWADTLSTLERTVDRQSLREFDHRVLFQMSSADSSNLIDSPIANQLGFHRALLYSEEQGGIEKFRPYALPKDDWLTLVRERLTRQSDADHTA